MKLQTIPIKVQFRFMKNYTYLVFAESQQEAILIDPAFEMDTIENVLSEYSLQLKGILVTHGHPDHVHLAKPFSEKYNTPVWMSQKDAEAFSFHCHRLKLLIDETPFKVANLNIRPLLTPGHTLGSVCYWIEDHLFTGDTLFIEGCGMCFGSQSDPQALFASLMRLKKELFSSTKIFPAHSYGKKPGRPFAELLTHNIYLNFEDEKKFVAYRMRPGQVNLFRFQ